MAELRSARPKYWGPIPGTIKWSIHPQNVKIGDGAHPVTGVGGGGCLTHSALGWPTHLHLAQRSPKGLHMPSRHKKNLTKTPVDFVTSDKFNEIHRHGLRWVAWCNSNHMPGPDSDWTWRNSASVVHSRTEDDDLPYNSSRGYTVCCKQVAVFMSAWQWRTLASWRQFMSQSQTHPEQQCVTLLVYLLHYTGSTNYQLPALNVSTIHQSTNLTCR